MRAPSKTVKTGTTAGAGSIVLVWAFDQFLPSVEMDPTVAGAIVLLITAAAAWIVPDPGRRAKH